MKLVVDANILVGELLRRRGRELVASAALDLYIADKTWSEARHELRERVEIIATQKRLPRATAEDLLTAAVGAAERCVLEVPADDYSSHEAEARDRIPDDPDDWPTVALALALEAGIWTQDRDFLGCGVPTWTTGTLLLQLTRPHRDG